MRADAELIQFVRECIDEPTAKQVEGLIEDSYKLMSIRKRAVCILNEKQQDAYDAWLKHKCRRNHDGAAIGGAVTFTVTPTGLGDVVSARCVCGSEIDLTHTEDW